MSSVTTTQTTPRARVTPLMRRLINKPTELYAELMILTPEDCTTVLAQRNPRNRKLSKTRRDSIADILKSGLWRVNGETVIFDSNGNLLDGQGRLAASMLTNIALETFVVFGIDPEAFDVIDRGKKRNLADDLSIDGEEYTVTLAASLSILWLDVHNKLNQIGKANSVPSPEARELLAVNPSLRDSVKIVSSNQLARILAPSVGAFLHYKFSEKDCKAADKFFTDLKIGANMPSDDPVLVLRNKLLQDEHLRGRAYEPMCLTIKAWNIRRSGKNSKLRWAINEGVPTIR
jgi:hypothetical protein